MFINVTHCFCTIIMYFPFSIIFCIRVLFTHSLHLHNCNAEMDMKSNSNVLLGNHTIIIFTWFFPTLLNHTILVALKILFEILRKQFYSKHDIRGIKSIERLSHSILNRASVILFIFNKKMYLFIFVRYSKICFIPNISERLLSQIRL